MSEANYGEVTFAKIIMLKVTEPSLAVAKLLICNESTKTQTDLLLKARS